MKTASWVIVEKSKGKAVLETFNELLASRVNAEKYRAVPILEYLQNFNKGIKK
jgi:hypothetical protein